MSVVEPIAIVGMACRFPGGANDPASYFRHLLEGKDAITSVPRSRFDIEAFFDPDPAALGKTVSRWGGFVDTAEMFDAPLFGISEHEAAAIDPQQRLLLEVSWEAIERAGYSPRGLLGKRGGVFVGLSSADYLFRQLQHLETLGPEALMATPNVAPGRISQYFGLRGPSVLVDTACSSALVAIHMAAQSLRAGDCEIALVGAANVIASPSAHVVFSRARALAPDGRCKSFDAAADGYVRSEGCAVLVLKTLSQAHADGDRIVAVIRGTAVNHNGRGAGLGVPDVHAQAEVVTAALANAGLAPDAVAYVEAHGTGTPLGDAMEIRALSRALLTDRPADRSLVVSAVKPNVGHCEAAAGLASLVKAVMSIEAGEIPAVRALRNVHPEITFDGPLVFAQTNLAWPSGARRIAGVHAYSVVGTNAHVILEGPPLPPLGAKSRAENDRPVHLLTLSARSPRALWNLAHRYEELLRTTSDAAVADVCYTAGTARAHLPHRLAITGEAAAELAQGLGDLAWGRTSARVTTSRSPATPRLKIAFAFSGTGHDARVALAEIARCEPSFKRDVETCTQGMELSSETALFVLQHALELLFRRWGMKPHVVLGEERGELAAACAAGILDPAHVMNTLRTGTPAQRPIVGQTRMISLITGALVPPKTPLPEAYFARVATEATRRSEALVAAAALGCDVVLELGPHPTLRAIGIAHAPRLAYLPALEDGRGVWSRLLATLGHLYVRGAEVDWSAFDAGRGRLRVDVPTYPFERTRHWIDREAFDHSPGGLRARGADRLLPIDEGLPARIAAAAGDERAAIVEVWVEAQVHALVGASSDLDGSVPLRDLGLDSLRGVDLLSLLTKQFGRAFPAALLLEHPTLDALTAYVSHAVGERSSE